MVKTVNQENTCYKFISKINRTHIIIEIKIIVILCQYRDRNQIFTDYRYIVTVFQKLTKS